MSKCHIVGNHMSRLKYDFNFLTTLQSGFISGDSTVNQLVCIYNSFFKEIDEDKEVKAVLCGISKAFD